MIDPEIGFTSDVIKDPKRFVGRTELIQNCIRAINSRLGIIAIYGKRGVGKSSLLRQIQQMALGDYKLAKLAGLNHLIPNKPRTYLTVYYQCDSLIKNGIDLITRLCNDQNHEDGLLRLVPNDGKELIEFTRTDETDLGADLKVINWGTKGTNNSKYARVVPDDIIQTFRNYIDSILVHQVKKRMGRDGLLILLDEFDVIEDKSSIGSLIKSLSSENVKFGICGIANDINDLVADHASIERLLEEGSINVRKMPFDESIQVIYTAQKLFKGNLSFEHSVAENIASISEGYPYLIQLIGKACVNAVNKSAQTSITMGTLDEVLQEIKNGDAFPTLETAYQRAIGDSEDRRVLLHLLAEQPEQNTLFNDEVGRVVLKNIRADARDLELNYIDQLLPRLIDKRYGPVLVRVEEKPGLYEFTNPIFRIYVKLRKL